jgi:hypothetical protein
VCPGRSPAGVRSSHFQHTHYLIAPCAPQHNNGNKRQKKRVPFGTQLDPCL